MSVCVFNYSDNKMLSQAWDLLDVDFFVTTLAGMATKKRGAPRKGADRAKAALIQFRVHAAEKEAFNAAAELDGKKLSEWMRDRLRRDAKQELLEAGLAVAFLPT